MVATALKLVGFDLQRQYVRLKAEAEAFKERTADDIKQKAVDAGLQVALAFTGLIFIVIAAVAALVALYLYVEVTRGTFAGLGAVVLVAAILALTTFIIAANWGRKRKSMPRAEWSDAADVADAARVTAVSAVAAKPVAKPASSPVTASHPAGPSASSYAAVSSNSASLIDTITKDITDRTSAAANEALDAAAGIVRKSPPEAIFGAMAVAVVAGILIGRRRADTP